MMSTAEVSRGMWLGGGSGGVGGRRRGVEAVGGGRAGRGWDHYITGRDLSGHLFSFKLLGSALQTVHVCRT